MAPHLRSFAPPLSRLSRQVHRLESGVRAVGGFLPVRRERRLHAERVPALVRGLWRRQISSHLPLGQLRRHLELLRRVGRRRRMRFESKLHEGELPRHMRAVPVGGVP